MTIWYSPDDVPGDLGNTVVTIGVFDGLHRGHQAVVGAAVRRGSELGLPVVAVTFDPHPMAVIRPEQAPLPLMTVAERAHALTEVTGADHVLVLPFNRDRSEQLAADFVDDILVHTLRATVVVVGSDFRFGYRAKGDVGLLASLGERLGFEVASLDPVGDDSVERWSSTAVRSMLAAGDVAAVSRALGRPWTVSGVVVRGDQRGRLLGFPTANVPTHAGVSVPADGVYAGWLQCPDVPRLPAAISVGSNPTFDGAGHRVEAHALDRDDLDLYGCRVVIEFVDWIRGQERFSSTEELIDAIDADIGKVRERLTQAPGEGPA